MVRKYFYLINYIIHTSLFGYKGKVFCIGPKGCMSVLQIDTPRKDNPLQKVKEMFQ